MKLARLALICALVPATAAADPAGDEAEARRYFDAGSEAFAQNHYDLAVKAFEEAYRHSTRPSVKFALAQACRFQFVATSDLAMARRALVLFRELVNEIPDGPRRSQSAQYISELEPAIQSAEAAHRIAEVTKPKTELMMTSRTPNAIVSFDGSDETAPSGAAAEVAAGAHKLRVSSAGYAPQEVEATAIEGRMIVVDVELVALPARIAITAPAGSEIEIDGTPKGRAPLAGPIEIPAGTHFVAAMKHGSHPWSREVTIGRGDQATLDAHLHRTNQRLASRFVLGAGISLAIAGGVTSLFALRAQHQAQDLEDQLGHRTNLTGDELAAHNAAVRSLDDRRTVSYVLYGASAATLATAALLYVVDHQRVEPRSIVVAPVAGPHGGSISIGRRF